MAGNQYLNNLDHKDLPPAMQDLPVMYVHVIDVVAAATEDRFDQHRITRDYPHAPKLSDREVGCLAAAAEADSENLPFARLDSYEGFLPHRGGRQAFKRRMLGDKGHISGAVQLSFADTLNVEPEAIPKANAKNAPLWPREWKVARRYVETVFSQLCDEARAKHNLAKRLCGLDARISTKLLMRTIKQFVNYHTGRSLNQTRHRWAGLA